MFHLPDIYFTPVEMLNNWYSRWICEFPSDGLSPINLTPMISLRQSFVSWVLPETQSSVLTPFPGILGKISWSWYIGFNWCFMVSWQLDAVYFPVDTGRKLNLHKTFRRRLRRLLNVLCTFNLCPVSTGLRFL